MSGRRQFRLWLGAVALGVAVIGSFAGAEDIVVRYRGTSKGTAHGHPVTMLDIASLDGASTAVAIPNDEGKTPQPRKELMTVVGKLQPNAIVKVGIEPSSLGPTLTSIEPYDAKPGEDTPHGYVFEKTYEKPGKTPVTTIFLTKFGKEYPFTVSTRRNPDTKQMEQDPEVMDAVAKLQEGNSVWISALGSKLVAIMPYTEPSIGKIVKIGDTEIDGHKVPSADIETDNNKTVTVVVPVKPVGKNVVPDATVNGQLHKFRPQAEVAYRVREDAKTKDLLWLMEISAAPKNSEKPASKVPEKDSPKKK